jgi:outer membrane protein TolC
MARDASSYRGLAVSEQFPAPGKLKLQGAIAAKDVEAAQAALEGLRRRIAAEVQAAYYDYFFYGKALESAHRNQRLLEEVEQIAEAQYRAGKVEQPDVLRAQVEISLLLEKTVLLEQQRSMAEARLDSFLLRSPDEPLPPADEVHPDPLPVSLPQIYDMAAENDADAQGDSRTIERNRLSVALAQRQFRPDVGVSTMFQQRSDQAAMYGLTFSVNLPVFYKAKQRQAIVAATEEVIGAEKTRDGRLNQLRLELRQQLIAATTANKLMALYTKGVIPQTSLALESSMAAYQAAKTEIQPVLANMTTLLDYESDYYRQLADYQTALARIASLTGKEK